jgi:predicted metal-dependent HD superfamily phosphohydrolase
MSLEGRFAESARLAGAAAPSVALDAVEAELIARWSEPHRHYHNLAHLEAVLREAEADPVAALAAWGHDAIYDPRSPANEERSAQLMGGLLTRCAVPQPVISETLRLVRLTAGHRVEALDKRGVLLADADLAVLAWPWPDYLSYVDAVRREYAHVPEDLWRIGRAAVLQSLLDLPSLFHQHPALEAPARENIARELESLFALRAEG